MNEPTPAVQAIVDDIVAAVHRDHRRRIRRRKVVRTGGLSVLVLTAASSAALAAGGAFRTVETVTPVGEVQLPQNVTIQAVDSFPEFVGTASPSGFVTRTAGGKWGGYIYHVTGGEAHELGCGGSAIPTNNIYITSTRPLSEKEIRSLLQPDGQLIDPKQAPRPSWITSTSDGCPNPGVAGQPGTPGVQPPAVKSSVAVPTSTTTHILVRKITKVPVGATTTPTDTGSTPTSAPSAGSGTPASTSPTTTSSSNADTSVPGAK
jgi:hypothetical protein